MSVADKIAALFATLRVEDIRAMPPAARRRFADTLRHWQGVAEAADAGRPRSGVLGDLRTGRAHE
jgi:hypothetical protein